jgi:membrane associated rhomboid family serine protease
MNEPDALGAETLAREPFFRAPKVVLILIAVLVFVHAAIQIGGPDWQVWSLYAFSFIPARITGDAAFPAISGSEVWSFLTYAFLHADIMHLFSTAFGFWYLVLWSHEDWGPAGFCSWQVLLQLLELLQHYSPIGAKR